MNRILDKAGDYFKIISAVLQLVFSELLAFIWFFGLPGDYFHIGKAKNQIEKRSSTERLEC